MTKIYDQLEAAQAENRASDAPTTAVGRFWLDTVGQVMKWISVAGTVKTAVDTNSTQTLTGKTIDGDDNTVQDLPLTALKTVLGSANTFVTRDASGIPVSTVAIPLPVAQGGTGQATAIDLDYLSDVDVASPEDGQALVYDATSGDWIAGASGDASFKLQSVTDPNATVKGGYLMLPDGRELATYDGAGSASTDFGKDITVSLDTILGSDPADATTYYLYIDLDTLGAEVTQTDTGRVVFGIVEANFYITTDTPDAMNLQRYVPRGFVRSATTGTVWSGAGAAFGTLASLRHDPLGSFFSYVEEKLDTATSAATKTVTHGLSGKPQIIQLAFWDDSAAKESYLDVSSHLTDNTDTQTAFDFSALTFAANDEVRIRLYYVPQIANGFVASAHRYESPWFESTATTSAAHGLTDRHDIRSVAVLEWNTTTGKTRQIDASALVSDWDDTTIYFDWTGLTPSSTLKYKVVTGGSPLPEAFNVSQSAYTPTNVTPDRSFDANSTTLDEIADVLGTLIADLQAIGMIK